MIVTGKFEVPYFIYTVPNHSTLKGQILDCIDKGVGIQSEKYFESISKSDWYTNADPIYFKDKVKNDSNSYYGLLKSNLDYIRDNILPDKHKEALVISNGWFHQYQKLDYYWWHNHPDCRWSLIYYVQLAENGPITEFENHFGNTIKPDVKEGDIIIFPGWLKHRAPPNLSTETKTILSFNFVEIFKGN